MNSVALTGIVGENPLNLTHVTNQNFTAQSKLDLRPIVFVVAEDASDRESLELLIRSINSQPVTFASVDEFVCNGSRLVPSCLILETSQDCNGLDLQKRLALDRPEMPIIFTTRCSDVRMAVQAMKAGAIEFLTQPIVSDLLLSAIQQALERSRVAIARQAEMRALKECYASLTLREREVMGLVVAGLLNKQVGAELGISEITVKAHRGKMMQKMQAGSLAQLVKMAAKLRVPAPTSYTMTSSPLLAPQAVA